MQFLKLHDTGKYAKYLRKLLLVIKKNAKDVGVTGIIPTRNGEAPSTDEAAALLKRFTHNSKRLRQILIKTALLYIIYSLNVLV